MAIEHETKTVTLTEFTRTWRINIESPRGEVPYVEIFRERVTVPSEGEATTYPSTTPIRIEATALVGLSQFCEIPDQLKAAIPDRETLDKLLTLLPGIVSIVGDAAERKKLSDEQ